jgi:hypothetical protein
VGKAILEPRRHIQNVAKEEMSQGFKIRKLNIHKELAKGR